MNYLTLFSTSVFLLGLGLFQTAVAFTIKDPGQGLFSIDNPISKGLSGITHIGGNQYLAVSDNQQGFYSLTISINSADGTISNASLGSLTAFANGSDYEGIAYNPDNDSVFASSEKDARIGEFRISDGAVLGTVSVPAVFDNFRSNKSLESLSYQVETQTLWTANEEALTTDGDPSSAGSSTVVRLQKFDGALNPVGQWAYVVDPATDNILFPRTASFSGLSDLLVLPDGQLLALEREFGGPFPGIRNRIYGIDFTGATDTSALEELEGQSFTPVNKTLLWEKDFNLLDINNFEGITLGPTLDNGDYSLLLIADDQVNQIGESLYALTLSGVVVPEPESVPEPLTILGSFTALAFGALFKKKGTGAYSGWGRG